MKICVIHGSNRKGNTDRTIDIIKERLNSFEDNVVFFDIYLPKDLPCFCEGCFACLLTGDYAGQNCPHKQYTHPIVEKILASDGIIVASPCYALAETGQVKAFFDHFACQYIVHRPYEEMFGKVGFIVSTAAGAGTGRVVSTIRRNLLFWGIGRVVKCRMNIWADNWDNIPDKKRCKFEKLLQRKTRRFYKLLKNKQKKPSLYVKVLLFFFKRMIRRYPDTNIDKIYWRTKKWID